MALPSFILTSRPFIASEAFGGGGDEYFQGSKKPVWDELPPNSQVHTCTQLDFGVQPPHTPHASLSDGPAYMSKFVGAQFLPLAEL